MKKILTLATLGLMTLGAGQSAMAQSQTTGLALGSQYESRGSARYQALSGAMGAVGADFGVVHQNPAALALFRSGSKLSATLSHSTYGGTSIWGDNSIETKSKSKLHFDELSYMRATSLGSGKTLTWGIGIQNSGRFYRQMEAYTTQVGNASISDYVATLASNIGNLDPKSMLGKSAFMNNPWLPTLVFNSYWMDDIGSNPYRYKSAYTAAPQDASLMTTETGAMSQFDFALGAELSPRFSLGATLRVSSMNHEYRSYYQEAFQGVNQHVDESGKAFAERHGLSLDNTVITSSLGASLGLGLLFQPVDGLRLGASFYTPTVSSVRMDFGARATGISPSSASKPGAFESTTPDTGATNFRFVSPWRVGLSGAYVFGRTAILSADYEYQSLGQARLRTSSEDDYGYSYTIDPEIYQEDNDAISSDYGGQHTLRVGLEVNATRRLALRAGFRNSTQPVYDAGLRGDKAALEQLVPGSAVHYRLPGSVQGYSLGLGYRFTPKWTLDLAYVYRVQNDRVASFPFIRNDDTKQVAEPHAFIKDKQTQQTLSATLSYRF